MNRGQIFFYGSKAGLLAYTSTHSDSNIWRVPAEGGEESQVSDRVRQGSWAVWEKGVYFIDPEGRQPPALEFYSFADGRTARALTIEKELFWNGPGLSATTDGRRVLFAQNDQAESDIMLVGNFP